MYQVKVLEYNVNSAEKVCTYVGGKREYKQKRFTVVIVNYLKFYIESNHFEFISKTFDSILNDIS